MKGSVVGSNDLKDKRKNVKRVAVEQGRGPVTFLVSAVLSLLAA